MATMTAREAQALTNLTNLITTPQGSQSKIYPNEDTIVSSLQARARSDLPYTYVGSSTLLVVNPLRSLANASDASAKEYEKSFREEEALQPHVYDLAGRVYLMMQQRRESQSVVYSGITGSGKSFASKLFTDQILRLSSSRDQRLANQIKSVNTLLESFGSAKTVSNSSASQHSRYFELHFTADGRIDGAKVLTFGLNKSRLGPRLMHDERSFHVFYQLLAGAAPEERHSLNLEDPSSYALLASSGCYRLPGGPFSDDSIQLDELRVAMANLGFKAKHVQSIFSLLTTILLLGNLTFVDHGAHEVSYESATIENRALLGEIAHHLGVSPEDLEQALTNQTQYVKKDLCSVFLNAAGAAAQRDSLVRNLYSILFAFVVETANRKFAPAEEPELQIIQFDVPGFQSRSQGGAVATHGQNGFDEFAINFSNEVVHSYLQRRAFVDDPGSNGRAEKSGIKLPSVTTMDNAACMEMLRGGLLGNDKLAYKPAGLIGTLRKAKNGDDALLDDLTSTFGMHSSFVTSPGIGLGPIPKERKLFGINHYAGQCSYDADGFVEKSRDLVDSQLVTLLRNSTDSFIAKLVSGPSIATEGHPLDEDSIVEAQVSSAPLRQPSHILASISAVDKTPERTLDLSVPHPVTEQLNVTLASVFTSIDRTYLWNVACIRPNDSLQPNSFDKKRVKAQVRAMLLPDLIARRATEYVAENDMATFAEAQGLRSSDAETLRDFAANLGWEESRDFAIGHSSIWLSYGAWRQSVDRTRSDGSDDTNVDEEPYEVRDYQKEEYQSPGLGVEQPQYGESADDLLIRRQTTRGSTYLGAREEDTWSEYDKEQTIADRKVAHDDVTGEEHILNNKELAAADMVVKEKSHATVETVPTTKARRWWIRVTWLFTWWIPSFLLTHIGRMKRPDIRMAWREKLTIFMMIFGMCGIVIFYIVFFGRLLCPDNDKAWNETELSQHAGEDDYYAAIAGKVYDFTNFYKGQHSDIKGYPTTSAVMLQFAGQDLTNYFPVPMTIACPTLVTSTTLSLQRANFTPIVAYAVHTSGPEQTIPDTKLNDINWYNNELRPSLEEYYKGSYVMDKDYVAGKADSDARIWAIYHDKIYDLSDYLYTVQFYSSSSGTDLPNYTFLNEDITDLVKNRPGQDLTKDIDKVLAGLSADDAKLQTQCLDNAFLVGKTDFRKTARCTTQNYLLLAFSVLLMSTIAMKFVAALQLGSKRYPELLDKFVICQVPCYTEGEESLRRTIDSLADLRYDDKRKLIFIICDGNIIGSGNDRTTPRIVLDILGVDPDLNPEPLLFKSIGDGSKQLNYAKVYSGLYEFEGHVVPYMVIVKVGKPSERSKPGNRGKRDSQVLLLQYLNRVHFDAPMSPLELEIYHQMRNVIGIDPAFYEYIFQVDADTTVTPDSLNRMIACAADDQRIIGICGETKLANERQSLTTMIQVYEYYISHHLTKAFESLFGSVTCLPGCFSVYRIRTADKGRPIIISSRVIDEYAEPNVDTLHKKNLFSLGEDRYLTTLMMKNFPTFKMKFTPDAIAHTVAPDRWAILLSQRRRWINSTIHNLVELLFLPEMCGFCFFSMRFIVFIDLLGTIILPATCVYLFYLIITVSTGKAAIPIISLAMIAAVYGLQALIFILKREFMLIGWMIVYILAFPIYSFFLPIYSFWSMDDFSWGNTRVVVGEGNNKTVISDEAEHYDDSMIPLKKFSEYEAEAWETGSVHSEKSRATSHSSATRANRSQATGGGNYSRRPPPASVHSSVVPPGGDYWRDSSPLGHQGSNPNLRGDRSRVPSMAGMSQWGPGSVYGQSMNPFVESPAGSEYGFGHPMMPPHMPGMQMQTAPRNSVMTNLNDFNGSMIGGYAPPDRSQLGMPRPMSTFSLATTHNPFAGPSTSTDPSDEELLGALRHLLSTQDLMTVTKRSVREALAARFPQADLSGRTAWINSNIDAILSGS